ncbi:MAG: hypothetical protein JXQ95_04705 [Alteromonas stellipolaris]|uniref:hypothetical protein n=1 Tax=Alteromonas stellipolaris TaxID=233316 RepID=UPI003B8CCDA4
MSVDDNYVKAMGFLQERIHILDVDGLSELSETEIETFFTERASTISLPKKEFDSIVDGSDFDPAFEIISYYADSIDGLSNKQLSIVWSLMEDLFFLGRKIGVARGLTDKHETLKEYTRYIKRKIQPDAMAKDLYAKAGAKKFLKSREAAFRWMNQTLHETPDISKNRLAAMLEAKSKEEGLIFGRIIPEGTAKDYARKCINDYLRGVE